MNKSIALVALLTLGSATLPSRAEISVDFFYDALSPHGEWIDVADYGYAWHPRDVGRDWRPYSDGRWAYTDAGWTWVSDEPHGWATYHYGRWANVESVGWVWVPGTEWGPAWVSWRRSERHVGWAPLPPESTFRASVSIGNWADSYYDIGPANYSFVEVRHLGAPRLRTVILPARENIVFVRETRNITNIFVRNEIVINEGPRYDEVSRISAEPIQRLRLDRRQDVRADVASMRTRVEGDSLSVAAPAVNFSREAAPRRVARKVADTRVNRGWTGVNAAPQEVERLRASVKQEAAPPADLPAKPTFDRERAAGTAGGKAAAPGATTSRPGETATTEKKEAPSATVPSSPDTPDARGTATTPDSTPPARDARRPGSRGGLREETTGKPDSTSPAEATTPVEPKGRGKGRTSRESSTTPTTATPEATDTKVKPESTRSETEGRPGRAVRPGGEDARGRRGSETGKPETPGSSATPGSPDPASTGRTETPGRSTPSNRPESPGRSEAPVRETPKAEAEKPRSESSRSEAPGNSRAKRSEAPTERPEPKATPTPQERPQAKPERSSRAPERENRSAASAAERANAARNSTAERIQPKAEKPQPKAERPDPRAERPEARAERPQPKTERLPAVAERPAQQKGQPKVEASSGGSGEEKGRGKKKEQ